ncbi:SMC-Scp complex subunit ScpB [soil metagenome]
MTATVSLNGHDTLIEQSTLPLDSFSGDEGCVRLAGLIESLALVSDDGIEIAAIVEVTSALLEQVEVALDWANIQPHRGIVLERHGDRVSISSNPAHTTYIRRLLKLDREAKLTPAALEALAIVAYQQPVTRSEIDAVRGVDSSGVIATLHNRGLVEAVGRRQSVGAPIEYGTTLEFLRLFGLSSLDSLPPLGIVDGRDLSTALEAAVASHEDLPIEPVATEYAATL